LQLTDRSSDTRRLGAWWDGPDPNGERYPARPIRDRLAHRRRWHGEVWSAKDKLNHPNIFTLYDVGNESGVDYLVMELLEGETLAARLERLRE